MPSVLNNLRIIEDEQDERLLSTSGVRRRKIMMLTMQSVLAAALTMGNGPIVSRCPQPVAQAATASLTTLDAAKFFGRFAEQTLYLDGAVGACCHSACSDCEWRLPDGGYRFDLMKASVAKWVPCYLARDFGDERGCHTPVWASTLFPDGAASISRADFDARVNAMEYVGAMGPKGTIKDAELSAEALDALWAALGGGDELEAATMVAGLQALSLLEGDEREGVIGEGPDSLVWKEFAKGLGVAPFERF